MFMQLWNAVFFSNILFITGSEKERERNFEKQERRILGKSNKSIFNNFFKQLMRIIFSLVLISECSF